MARHFATPVDALQHTYSRVRPTPDRHNPADGLERDALKSDPVRRIAAPRHPSVPDTILETLSSDADPRVRRAVAGSRRTSPATLARLSEDEDFRVRQLVLENERTPEPIRAALVRLATTTGQPGTG